jgi:hypothetical protein
MDRSFLSRPEVVAASRKFVCVRLATYESKEEGAFLESFEVGRSGKLENSLFCILSSDGKRELSRAGRSLRRAFGDAEGLAATMNRIARTHKPKAGRHEPDLPRVAYVRLALNVAACDNQPLVVLYARDASALAKLEKAVAVLAWQDAFLGRFIYAATGAFKDFAAVKGAKDAAGVLVIGPDSFGLKGEVLGQVAANSPAADLTKGLKAALARHKKQTKSFRSHVRAGHEKGVFWETQIPVTDPEEAAARARGRRVRGR